MQCCCQSTQFILSGIINVDSEVTVKSAVNTEKEKKEGTLGDKRVNEENEDALLVLRPILPPYDAFGCFLDNMTSLSALRRLLQWRL